MKKKVTILVCGLGGVGGYFGGLLAKHYINTNVEIYFLARGAHLKAIKQNGLSIIHNGKTEIVYPAIADNDPQKFGKADYIILATKAYDMSFAASQLAPCFKESTIVLPLINGIDNYFQLKRLLVGRKVLNACVYIVSRLIQPGLIHNSGNIQKIYFGSPDIEWNDQLLFQNILCEAGIEAIASKDIENITWEKFLFISPLATATSYFDSTVGQLAADEEKLVFFKKLLCEITEVALRKGIRVANDTGEKILHKIRSLPFENTTSMHSDFRNGKPLTEIESLTGYVLSSAREYGLTLPAYEAAYNHLKQLQE